MPGAQAYAGVYRGRVVQPPAGFSGLWVVVPRLNGDAPMGPCDHLGAASGYNPGDKVLVATLAGIKDDLAILGPVGG